MRIPETVKDWMLKPVAVFGRGVSGEAACRLIERLGGEVVVYDERGKGDFDKFEAAEAERHCCVVVSPGFRADHPWLQAAREGACDVVGELDLASLLWRGRTIAVTGTNGKTTMVEFISHSLREAG